MFAWQEEDAAGALENAGYEPETQETTVATVLRSLPTY